VKRADAEIASARLVVLAHGERKAERRIVTPALVKRESVAPRSA